MKQLTLLLGFVLLLAACAAPPAVTPTAVAATVQMVVASDDFAVGESRLPFILYSGPDRVSDARRVQISLFDLSQEPPQPAWQGEAIPYTDYEVPYWVVHADFPHAGFWGVGAVITLADGSATTGQLAVQVNEQSSSPAVGSRPPAVANRTLATEPDIARLTSDFDAPEPALYQLTVAEAMTLPRPLVVSFSTPAFCASQMCAPVLTTIKQARQQWGDQVSFIHIEVYQEFEPLLLADEVTQWQLTSEPWTFLLDSDGRVAARFGGPLALPELQAALTPLLHNYDQ